ncbi:DUF58 domain-containing protein [Marinobacter panjinensis]|uniref:DUF58 domain-containing protein n=1 Tax=Marinobacter panjinensis TaxID=2576384 RepID=A0A4U6R1A1_9GAMM|nr:DUF58 domain-containing protein [Marinobacter panjinensis]MCR8915881.1 DUF58 domain-containing protein [Marinobacter panjinensis]TKV67149.1 DUF58 domain-containing protein [Marinobacter panjinensis]
MLKAIRKRWQHWVNQRIPRSDQRAFGQRNIFILPTGAGVVFGFLLLIMLITGINYQNSLIYLLTFLLGAVAVAAMHQTHRNLSGLELTLIQAGEGFAGDLIPFRLRAVSPRHDTLALSLACEDVILTQQHIPAGQQADLHLSVPSYQRGYLQPQRILVETRFPFGLFRAWSWLRPVTSGIVYPNPLVAPDVASTVQDGEEQSKSRSLDGNDHADIRPWREGDMSQRVQWKRYARTGEMVIADWEGEQGSPHWLDYEAFAGTDRELRLGYLTHQVLERSRNNSRFGLNLPGQVIEPDTGAAHTNRCLKALAIFGLEQPREGGPLLHGTRAGEGAGRAAHAGGGGLA